MGCVIYYTLTGGSHPFGSSLRRQANIEAGEADLSELTDPGNVYELDVKRSIKHAFSSLLSIAEKYLHL